MDDITKQLAFLKARGYEIGDSFVPPDGKIHTHGWPDAPVRSNTCEC